MSAIIELLKSEHRNLAKLLKALEHQLGIFDSGEAPDYQVISGILGYCRTYSDRFHHPKEDLVLAQLLQRDPEAAARVGDLAGEHTALAELTERLDQAVADILAEAEIPRAGFEALAREFLETYWTHMRKEEEVFFPAALEALSTEDWVALDAHVTDPGDPLFGAEAEERFGPLRDHLLAWDRESS